jgi:2-dehydro-3-deoxyphosphooctonate aldolase (KDO 8-P synthase)
MGYPVIFDVTHSLQLPGGLGKSSGGQKEFISALARAAVAVGIDGLFMEVHPNPEAALCDGPNSQALSGLRPLLEKIVSLDRVVKDDRPQAAQGGKN